MVALVVSSLVVRVVPPGPDEEGFRLLFEGEIAGLGGGLSPGQHVGECPVGESPVVTVTVTTPDDSWRGEASGVLGADGPSRFRVETGLVGAAGRFSFRVSLGADAIYRGAVRVERPADGLGFGLAREHLLQGATLQFGDSPGDRAPSLVCSFWSADDEGDPRDFSATLYCNGRPVVHSAALRGPRSAVRLQVLDRIDGPDRAHSFRLVELRIPDVRAFVLDAEGGRGVVDLSAHPGIYAIRIARGGAVIRRMLFEIGWSGMLRESGPVERRPDGSILMLLGDGTRFGPAPGIRATFGSLYEPWIGALPPGGAGLDAAQRWALNRVGLDLSRAMAHRDANAERSSGELHDLLTRIEELESNVPPAYLVAVGPERLPFERLRPIVQFLLESHEPVHASVRAP